MSELVCVSLPVKRYLVLGLGQTGQAVARWLASQGAVLVLADTRPDAAAASFEAQIAGMAAHEVQWRLGQDLNAQVVSEVDALVVSPGLIPSDPAIAPILQAAQEQGKAVLGEIELFAQALAQLAQTHNHTPIVLGITGTNGKTTVTALTRHMLEASGMRARAAGNISPAALDALADDLSKPQDQWTQAWVLELSSFQLHYVQSLSLQAATVLNVTQDHLDWHGSFEAYCQDKAKIFEHAQIKIVNRDDEASRQMVMALDMAQVRSFGSNQPVFAHDVGVELSHDVRWLVSAEPQDFEDQPKPARRRKGAEPLPRSTGRLVRLMPADALPMVGMHNVLNVLAAGLLARAAGVGWGPILKAAGQYQGEAHRMQFVRTIREVDFFNDSKGTNVGATVAGLIGLNRPVVLIAGGQSKGQDFSPLARALKQCARAVVLMGEDASRIAASLAAHDIESQTCASLADAVKHAFELAQTGDAVVLSPACASFDMFSGYPHRGDVFVAEVVELGLSLGEVA